ncbi:MAG: sn-glycerol-3-phosphate ABC transporter ATP-binding protein UgpC [Lachnospiraceae bacterium]|nr:sn-glycerol-3-phosphate ABC transporter ATP-binding protein UgpC [Lachnospiraceae bacterium]
MAEVRLKDVMKIYPPVDTKKHNVKHLEVTEKGVVAVQQFNIDIQDKEFIVLVGPSGCGKTTTLRMIAGLEEISEGELYIDGELMNAVAPKDRDIAMVFQSYALYPHMTVFDNMAYSLKIKHVPKDEIKRRVEEAAEILDITKYLQRKPKALSGGQRQRVAIGRAIVRNPKVLLMDEPLSNLDAKLRNQMRAELLKLQNRIQTTIVYVTHDQVEAMTLGDRIVVMKDAYIQQIGTPQEVFNHPANTFVAGFIGTPQMNFFEGELLREGNDYSVKYKDYVVKLSENKAKRLAENHVESQSITFGVRPDQMRVGEEGLTAVVEVSEMMGTSSHLHTKIDGQDVIVIVPTNGDDASEMEEIKVSFSGKMVHVFSKEDGRNLEFSV